MNNKIFTAICTAVGTVAGFAAGAFWANNRANARADEEIAAMREYYLDMAQPDEDEVDHEIEKDDEIQERRRAAGKAIWEQYKDTVAMYDQHRPEGNSKDGKTKTKPKKSGEKHEVSSAIVEGGDEDTGEVIKEDKQMSQEPKIIRAEEFGDFDDFDQVDLVYYDDDDILADEDDNVIEDYESLVGDALVKYGFITNEEQNLYVRNFDRRTDYHIYKVYTSYQG